MRLKTPDSGDQKNQINRSQSETGRILKRLDGFRYVLILEGIVVGLLAGIVIVAFRLALERAAEVTNNLIYFAGNSVLMIGVYTTVMIAVAMGISALLKWEPLSSGSGIPQLEGELTGELETKWWRVLLVKFAGGVLAIGSGMSLGREGPSVQLGAMVGKGFSQLTKRLKTEEKMLMTCGAGAGLAAAFNAPFAGVIFALEELHKNFSRDVLLCTMAAAIASDFACRYVFGLKPIFKISVEQMMPLKYYGYVILLGLALGVMGVLFNLSIKKAQELYDKIPQRLGRILVPSLLLVVAGLAYPKIMGGGNGLVDSLATGSWALGALVALFLLKWLFTVVCFGSGAPGGIFLPQLVLGAVLGSIFFKLCSEGLGMNDVFVQNFVILGMTGYFAAVVRAPITGIILICEMTGSLSHLLTLSIVSLAAYVVADILNGKPVYEQLLERILAKEGFEVKSEDKRLIESPVYFGSAADGLRLKDFPLPKGCLIVSLSRRGEEIVPNGSTEIKGGDKLVVLCAERHSSAVEQALRQACREISTGEPVKKR